MSQAIDYQSDPDSYRMSIGDHLEELRRRLIQALIGFVAALALCLVFGRQMMAVFCRPMIDVLREYDLNPQMYFTDPSEPFMIYLKISMICAAVIASPWIVWQVWLFIAAGLYPHEKKTVTRYVPLSLALLISGVAFVYYFVLPWTLQFFVAFSITIPLPAEFNPKSTTATVTAPAQFVQALDGDPVAPQPFQMWFDKSQSRLKFFYDGQVRVIQFGPANLMAPMLSLPMYIDLVLGMLIVFGLSFQLPLIVLALATLGIIEVDVLKKARTLVYFVMAIAATVITPGDVITATVALAVPLCLLFELGIFLAARGEKVNRGEDTVSGGSST